MSKRRFSVIGQSGFILTIILLLLLPVSGGVIAKPMSDESLGFVFDTDSPEGEEPTGTVEAPEEGGVGILAVNAAPQINVWYGLNQTFGHIGNPQDRINILGNVRDADGDTVELRYALNSGSQQILTLGTENIRLVENGDFNLEIFDEDLSSGENTVVLTAEDSHGGTTSVTVIVDYRRNNDWLMPFFTDWQGYESIQDRAEIIDGKWALEQGGLRTKQIGYDRLIGMGDFGWTDYEVSVPLTILGADTSSGGVGIIVRWQGHGGSSSPTTDWTDMGAYGYYSFRKGGLTLRLNGNEPGTDMVKAMGIDFGTTYMLKLRVQTLSGAAGSYSLKIWDASAPEPSGWDLTGQDDSTDKPAGAMLLVAHYVDVRFGDVKITPLNFNQTYSLSINGTGSGNVIRDPSKSSYSFGEEVWLTADPDTGWVFSGWDGDAAGTTNPARVVMDGNKVIDANFEKEGGTNLPPMLFLPNIFR